MPPKPLAGRGVLSTAAAALALVVLPAGVYLAFSQAAAVRDAVPLEQVLAFHPDRTPLASLGRKVIAAGMVAGAVGLLFLAPAFLAFLAARRISALRPTAHVWSLIVNSLALSLVLAGLRWTIGIGRLEFTAAWCGWTVLLFAAAWRPGRTPAELAGVLSRWRGPVAVGVGTALAAIVVLFPEQFIQCFSEDGTEACELARSLREHVLPTWEFDTGDLDEPPRFGTVIVNPALVNSTWTCATQTLLGDGELGTRLPFWIWWLAIFLVCCRLVRPEVRPDASGDSPAAAATHGGDRRAACRHVAASIPIALLMLLWAVLFTFYVGYNPYMADVANPGVPDALFTLCLLAGFECLRHRDRWGFVLTMTLASLVLYAGPVLLVLTLAAAWLWRPIPRREVWTWGGSAFAVVAAVAAAYLIHGAGQGLLTLWLGTFDLEYVNDYLAAVPRWKSAALFFGYFVFGAGGLAAWGMVSAFRGNPWQRTVGTAAWAYLAIVLGSGYKNLHYLAPLWPVPLVLFLGTLRDRALIKASLAAFCSIVVCLVLSWPNQRSTFVLNRELGAQTTFATESYETAAYWSRIMETTRLSGLISWDCDRHTWLGYAEYSLAANRPLLVTMGPTPHGYQPLVYHPLEMARRIAMLSTRDPDRIRWLSSQQPLRPVDRYPRVFLPLAEGPYSPHNNRLEDVRRF